MKKTPETQQQINPAEEPQKATLKKALKDISTAGGLTVFVITMLSSFSLPGILSTLLKGEFGLDAEGIRLIWEMIRLTAPLTLGIAIIILALMQEWIEDGYAIIISSGIVLVITTLLLREDGQSIISTAWKSSSGNILITFPLQLLIQYFRIYFWIPFVSSFIIGFFISWSVSRLMSVQSLE